MKRNKTILLFAIVGIIAAVAMTKFVHKKPATPPPAPVQHIEPAKPERTEPKQEKISVDFNNAPLLDIAPLLQTTTGRTLLFNGNEDMKITWLQQNMAKYEITSAFTKVIDGKGFTVKQVPPNYLSIEKKPEALIPVPVNYLSSAENIWFELNNQIYTKEEFPYQLREDNKRWFALIPKSLNEKILAQQSPETSDTKTN